MIKPIAAPIPPSQEVSALRTAAEGFEAIFLRQLIGSMRQAKLADEMFGSEATESFRAMADARTADSMAGLGQFGIAAMLERQLSARVKSHE